jgi:triosephosphate isomerase
VVPADPVAAAAAARRRLKHSRTRARFAALPGFAALRYNFKDLPPEPGDWAGVRIGTAESDSSMRGKLVVGNWKMNGGLAANAALLAELTAGWQPPPGRELAVCVPYPYLAQVQGRLSHTPIAWGAQDVSEHDAGAYTGEVSTRMLAEFGCRYAIVGHSERRQFFGDTDAIVAAKARAALAAGLTPIACVGETLAERERRVTEAVVLRQLDAVLSTVGSDVTRLVVAYEPVWAIGTGRTASPAEAQAVHATLRAQLAKAGAADVRLLYGGSVKADNAAALFAMTDIDGGLIGGASLKAAEFLAIARA